MTWRNRPAGSGARFGRGRTAAARFAVVAGAAAIGMLGSAGTAHAAVTAFSMAPSSGPAGTVVHVSGSGCTPSLLGTPATDFVTVTAPSLGVSLQLPVASNGSWQGTFTVPAAAPAAPAPVAAVCTTGGLPSLFTLYSPQTFDVTGSAAPPTTPVVTLPPAALPPLGDLTGGSGGGGTTTTTPPPRSTAPGTTPKPPVTGVPGEPGATPIGVPGSANGSSGGGDLVTIGTGTSRTAPHASDGADAGGNANEVAARGPKRASSRARSATLEPVGLNLTPSGSGSGRWGWLAWALVVALALASLGAPVWLRVRRRDDSGVVNGEAT